MQRRLTAGAQYSINAAITMAFNNSKLPKQQFSVVVELDAPIEQCFAASMSEDAMMHWVPSPKSIVYDNSKASEPYGAGSERLITVRFGFSLVERIHISDKPTFLAYNIPTFGFVGDWMIENYQGRMTFEPIDRKRTRLRWVGYFDSNGLAKHTEPFIAAVIETLISIMANKLKKYLAGK